MLSRIRKIIFLLFSTKRENAQNAYHKITIGGPVPVYWTSFDGSEDREITDIEIIRKFDGLCYLDSDAVDPVATELSVYLQDGTDTKHLYDLGVRKGVVSYRLKGNAIWVEYFYTSPKKLKNRELHALKEFTKGQCSDGAGPIFSGDVADSHDGISPLPTPRELYVSHNT